MMTEYDELKNEIDNLNVMIMDLDTRIIRQQNVIEYLEQQITNIKRGM